MCIIVIISDLKMGLYTVTCPLAGVLNVFYRINKKHVFLICIVLLALKYSYFTTYK